MSETAFTAEIPARYTGANEFDLSRNHDGDLLLVINGKVHSIAAKFGSPLFCAILNFRADALEKVGVGGTAPEGHNGALTGASRLAGERPAPKARVEGEKS